MGWAPQGFGLMARLRSLAPPPAPSGVVPAELLDPSSRVWRDPDLFAAWVIRHVPGADVDPRRDVDSCVRFRSALDAWAYLHGLIDPVYGLPDSRRLAALGVRQCRRLRG